MSIAWKQSVWLPPLLTAIFAVTYLVPIPSSLFTLHLERLSGIGAPAFMVFRELSGVTDLAPLRMRFVLQCALLVVVTLCWFTFILLPFWSDFRLGGLSLRSSQFLFAFSGIVLTVFCWWQLGGWRTIDE